MSSNDVKTGPLLNSLTSYGTLSHYQFYVVSKIMDSL